MCDWIDREIAHISDDAVIAPQFQEYLIGRFETTLPGIVAPMRLRKIYTRIVELGHEVDKVLTTHGLLSEDGEKQIPDDEGDIPQAVLDEIYPIGTRITALQSALAANLMAEHDLWKYPCVLIGNAWEIYYRTHEQEERFRASFSGLVIVDEDGEDFGSISPYDPSLN
ncbi:MAG: hypothetical protein G01um101448_1192 [Parcubacteria group bacterium Gr01-1014_48]|nr:MAG: hypothetical protein G01um101448_1192 [Parcubacteria group bacterium Gr01-1014_48]